MALEQRQSGPTNEIEQLETQASPSPDLAIHCQNISLVVETVQPKTDQRGRSLARLIGDLYSFQNRRTPHKILSDLSFQVREGERLGIIGRNGAGKTTLIKVLASVYRSSSGKLTINGKVRGLLDAKLGMRPDGTGMENIYLRGMQMGLTPQEVRERSPQILEFAELGDAINAMYGSYSSGMKLRLAFSISLMFEPDILVMDEWVGAGDADFRKKIRAKMQELVEKSRALVLATHGQGLMKSVCSHGLVLDGGRAIFYGNVADALRFYREEQGGQGEEIADAIIDDADAD